MPRYSTLQKHVVARNARAPYPYAGAAPGVASPIARANNPDIVAAQERLAAHGFDPGTRNGYLDVSTRRMVLAFQQAKGLTQTPSGVIDSATATALAGAPGRRTNRMSNYVPGINHHVPAHGRPTTSHFPTHPQGASRVMSSPISNKDVRLWKPTGLRVPLVLAQSIAANATALVTQNPQMDFRGENFVIDATIVGPNCTVTVPTVGTVPQVAGGPAGTGVPGTVFSPAQNVPLDFQMIISNQGNAVATTVVNTITTSALNFAALLFGQEVAPDMQALAQNAQAAAAAAGMAPAGAFAGMAPAGAFAGAGHHHWRK